MFPFNLEEAVQTLWFAFQQKDVLLVSGLWSWQVCLFAATLDYCTRKRLQHRRKTVEDWVLVWGFSQKSKTQNDFLCKLCNEKKVRAHKKICHMSVYMVRCANIDLTWKCAVHHVKSSLLDFTPNSKLLKKGPGILCVYETQVFVQDPSLAKFFKGLFK